MRIKETPTNYKTYYKLFIADCEQKLEEAIAKKEQLEEVVRFKYENLAVWTDEYEKQFGVKLDDYIEFKENKYINGKFYKLAEGLFINKQNDYELVSDLFNLFDLANTQKEIHICIQRIDFYNKCVHIKLKEYANILRAYYTEVHKKLILEGQGYAFGNGIGWICVNRCIFDRKKKMLDYAATKKREKELKENGKRIYNKEEAEWCIANGLEYKAEDKRVFVINEYAYQIPLIGSKLKNGDKLKLEISDYRHSDIRGKTNNDLIELCNKDTKKICELPIDLKTKVTLCDKVDKILYTKFIRNENQKPIAYGKAYR